mgnify:CR=1 FL=1
MYLEKQKLQDAFLHHLLHNNISVVIFLMNGVKLQGSIAAFDTLSLLLKRDGQCQMVYKHAISTVSPCQAINLGDDASEESGEEQIIFV